MSLKYSIFLTKLSVFMKDTTGNNSNGKEHDIYIAFRVKKEKKSADGVQNFKCIYLRYAHLLRCKVRNIKSFSLLIG